MRFLRISWTLERSEVYAASDFCFSRLSLALACSRDDIRDCNDVVSVPFGCDGAIDGGGSVFAIPFCC